ncbi:Gfo/Idh/MocA family protein [Planotetraspora phitsanulokensis]|uniref:Gfo/Idh/MocA family protein n=1 Tax=Planotetraspora phitsanulokensis TaxID=575192 RepID=UPI00194FFDC0|nr:Gfo/Idh/MocA family oxidoreductase [Planotetraspora phitsanulokensis]
MTSPQEAVSRPRVAVIGLGDIAQKAYLPVLGATPGLDLLFCTRDRPTLDRLGDAYRVAERFTSVGQVVAAGIDAAFVHAATPAHVDIVTELIEAGVHVFVDKPLAYDLPDAEKLVRLAAERRRSLMVGFNRRYAPDYAALRDLPRDLVIMQKNRASQPDDPRRVVFDDFIHVVDTLRFLAPGDVTDVSIDVRVRDGLLEHVVLHLRGSSAAQEAGNTDFTAIGIMSRVSGASEESCEVIGGGAKRRVVNLAGVVEYSGTEAVGHRGDWVPVARQRGIEQACQEFLTSVREGRLITADDALRTHVLCEEIVAAAG